MSQRTFEGPTMKIRMLETAADTGGARLRFEQTLTADAATPPRHVHAEQTETFVVKRGRLGLRAGAEQRVLEAGESLSVPPGVPHTLWNAGDGDCVHDVVLEPARDMEHFFEGIVALEALHALPPRTPRDLVRLALLFATHDNLLAGLPRGLQRPLFAAIRGAARFADITVPTWSEVQS